MEKKLTRDSNRLVCTLYKKYLERRKDGVSKDFAKYFSGSREIQAEIMPEETFADVDETCRELDRAGFLVIQYADDIAYRVWLSDDAIIYMENRFKDGIKDVAGFLAQFIP